MPYQKASGTTHGQSLANHLRKDDDAVMNPFDDWTQVFGRAGHQKCDDHIEACWTGMRPEGLNQAVRSAN